MLSAVLIPCPNMKTIAATTTNSPPLSINMPAMRFTADAMPMEDRPTASSREYESTLLTMDGNSITATAPSPAIIIITARTSTPAPTGRMPGTISIAPSSMMIAPSCKTIQLTFSSIAAFSPCVFNMFENPVINPRLICAMPTISVTTSKVSMACVLWIGYVIISPPRPCMISIVCHPGIKPGCP